MTTHEAPSEGVRAEPGGTLMYVWRQRAATMTRDGEAERGGVRRSGTLEGQNKTGWRPFGRPPGLLFVERSDLVTAGAFAAHAVSDDTDLLDTAANSGVDDGHDFAVADGTCTDEEQGLLAAFAEDLGKP